MTMNEMNEMNDTTPEQTAQETWAAEVARVQAILNARDAERQQQLAQPAGSEQAHE